MKWLWILPVLLVAVLVKGVSSGALSGPQDIPRQMLAYERAVDAGQRGKIRVARPEIETAAAAQPSVADGALTDARVAEAEAGVAGSQKKWVKVTGNVVNVRVQPDLASETVTRHRRDTALQVLRERGEWRLVLDPDTKTSGWMHRDYLEGVESSPQVASSE